MLCNTNCFSTTPIVARTHLTVTLYVHCWSCCILQGAKLTVFDNLYGDITGYHSTESGRCARMFRSRTYPHLEDGGSVFLRKTEKQLTAYIAEIKIRKFVSSQSCVAKDSCLLIKEPYYKFHYRKNLKIELHSILTKLVKWVLTEPVQLDDKALHNCSCRHP